MTTSALTGGTARATMIGFGAILLWSLLALFTSASGGIPPFQLAAITFLIVGAAVNYLWPLLIVLFSAWLPGSRGLRPGHLLGAALGLAGVGVLFVGRDIAFAAAALPGYAAALAAAFVWAGYSVLSARAGAVPTEAVAGFCLATGGLSLLCHLALERTVWPQDPTSWAAIVLLGLGPVGAAFYLWDIGCKRGDVRLLGVAAYAAPLLSTLVLVAAGYAPARPALALSCLLIVAGALCAVRASRTK